MLVARLGLVLAVVLASSPLASDAPSPAFRRVPNEAEEESRAVRWSEPTRADIERRVARVRFNFPKVDAAIAVVDRAIPDFLTSARVRRIFLAATPWEKKASSPQVVLRRRKDGREPDGTIHLDALRDPQVRQALRYLGTTGIFAGEPEGPSSPRGKVPEPRPNE